MPHLQTTEDAMSFPESDHYYASGSARDFVGPGSLDLWQKIDDTIHELAAQTRTPAHYLAALLTPPKVMTPTQAACELIGFLPHEVKEARFFNEQRGFRVRLEVDLVDCDWEPTYEWTREEMRDMPYDELEILMGLVEWARGDIRDSVCEVLYD
jgi:hypothetical protein